MQVAEIIDATEADPTQAHPAQLHDEDAANTINLGYSIPMPGVRYYSYL